MSIWCLHLLTFGKLSHVLFVWRWLKMYMYAVLRLHESSGRIV